MKERTEIFEQMAKHSMNHGIGLLLNTTYDKELSSIRDRYADLNDDELRTKLVEFTSDKITSER